MAAVGLRDGIKYGFVLLGYFVGVFVLGAVVFAIGVLIANSDSTVLALIGALIAFVGVLILYAGFFGVAYKIIADGVATGINHADGLTIDRSGGTADPDRSEGTESTEHNRENSPEGN